MRPLIVTPPRAEDPRASSCSRWAWEVVRRTSAPARLVPQSVRADDAALLDEPFVVWWGSEAVRPLSEAEVRGLRQYASLGGIILVDDSNPQSGEFGRSAKRELTRVLPRNPVIQLPPRHVIYKTYYLLDRPVGRVEGAPFLEAMTSAQSVHVVFSSHDILGALARNSVENSWSLPTAPGGQRQRELALRLSVNLAMYVLCLDYKDDQVHAEELMRRRGRQRK